MDIYFEQAYGKLYEKIEHGTCECFEYSDEYGSARNIFIKRPIPWLLDGEQYYDIVTPYGYGGPLVIYAIDKGKLIENYWTSWLKYCKKEKIVCEFVRFSPLVNNQMDFRNKYDTNLNRHTIAIQLLPDFFESQFTSKCRNTVRKAEKMGVTCEIDNNCKDIDKFIELYYKTMKKNSASDYYFFPMEYFIQLKENLKDRIMLINAKVNGEIISSSLFMYSDKYMHYHLSATNPEYYIYSANNLILKVAARWGVENSKELLHLGGGVSASSEDRLLKFKASFGKEGENLKEFWIGRKIYNSEAYDRFVDISKEGKKEREESEFFPRYRI